MYRGLVMNTQKGFFNVKTEIGLLRCRLRGKLFNQHTREKSLVVVGDNVLVQHLHDDQGIILEICERKSKLARRGAGSKGRHLEQLIAANIDQAILVFAVKEPQYKRNLIDRYIAAAKSGGIEPLICFNKIDLIDLSEIQADIDDFQRLEYPVICTSTLTGQGIEELKEVLKGKLSVFSGSSGVGKSSLVNALFQNEQAKTNSVGGGTGKGKHTTTSAQIYELFETGMIVDTPGMREFGLFNANAGVEQYFTDITEIATRCKFSDCTHTHEPGCAVKEALEQGLIDPQRYESYLSLHCE